MWKVRYWKLDTKFGELRFLVLNSEAHLILNNVKTDVLNKLFTEELLTSYNKKVYTALLIAVLTIQETIILYKEKSSQVICKKMMLSIYYI